MAKMPPGFGFDPDVCEGCPHHTFYKKEDGSGGIVERLGNILAGEEEDGEQGYWGCGLCGCPTQEGMVMDRTGMPPRECPRLDGHEDQ